MKILWLSNIILPQIARVVQSPTSVGGGWLVGLADDLAKQQEIEFTVCAPLINGEKIISGKLFEMSYYFFPQVQTNPTKYNPEIEAYFRDILREVNPDIIHIFGTEYPHSLSMIKVCKELGIIERVVINIQGLTSVISKHYYNGIPDEIIRRYTFRDFIKQDNIKQQQQKFKQRGIYETQTLQQVQHVIGRTDWDHACIQQINPDVNYHFCNETLRPAFYEGQWTIETCEKYSIFISQCSYPVKGFHYMIEAMAEIIKKYPSAHIYTTGNSPLKIKGFKEKLKISSYQKYLGELIKKYNLENHITFLGALNETEMHQRFLKSHVFVSPSAIENSPNSVGEAMILGVPTISSDVGGVKNMLTHENDGFIYQADAPYMLAYYVDKIFSDEKLANYISENAQQHAKKTHDKTQNLETMLEIYRGINK